MIKQLESALRQYRHNNSNDVVFAYDRELINEFIQKLKSCENCKHQLLMRSGFFECKFALFKERECLQDYKYWEFIHD